MGPLAPGQDAGNPWNLTRTYFTSPSGKVVTQWPSGNMVYRVLTKLLGRVSETTRRRPDPDAGNRGIREGGEESVRVR